MILIILPNFFLAKYFYGFLRYADRWNNVLLKAVRKKRLVICFKKMLFMNTAISIVDEIHRGQINAPGFALINFQLKTDLCKITL